MNKGLSGLVNMGNTCYLNSAIQCLSNVITLTSYFLSGKYKNDINTTKKEHKMCSEYYKLLEGLWEDNCIVEPISFRQTLASFDNKYNNYAQHDAQEVLSTLLNLLHISLSYEVEISYNGEIKNDVDKLVVESIKQWGDTFKKQYSKILEIFYGQFYSCVQCNLCQATSNTYDAFNILSLSITANTNNIYDCLDLFTKKEVLDNNNKWQCEKCKQYGNAYKNISILKSPNILIIVLKRFNFNLFSSKINKLISFPLNDLNLDKYISGYDKYKSKYDAIGIINHVGGMTGGHYYAYCKNQNGKWYEYNDTNVRELGQISMNNAYMIFYKKK